MQTSKSLPEQVIKPGAARTAVLSVTCSPGIDWSQAVELFNVMGEHVNKQIQNIFGNVFTIFGSFSY